MMTTQDQKQKNTWQGLIAACESIYQYHRDQGPDWYAQDRQRAWNDVLSTEAPSPKNERWKYTNISPLFELPFVRAEKTGLPAGHDLRTGGTDGTDISVFLVNGVIVNIPPATNGLSIRRFSELSEEDYTRNIAPVLRPSTAFFENLNTALSADGLWIHIPQKTQIKPCIHICHIALPEEHPVIVSPRILLTAGPFAEADILMSFLSWEITTASFTNALTEVVLDRNARISLTVNQNEDQNRYHVNSLNVLQNRDSSFRHFSSVTGARLTRNELTTTLKEPGASADLKGIYLVQGEQHVDNHTEIRHIACRGTSNQLYKGILNDRGRAVFNGRVYVHPEAQQTNSYQLNKNLLMGEQCRVDTKPQLEIFADDVKCSHGATIGQLNQEEIFYLQARAIPKKQAVRMLARGFVEDIVNQIPCLSSGRKISETIGPVLSSMTYEKTPS